MLAMVKSTKICKLQNDMMYDYHLDINSTFISISIKTKLS